MELDRVNEFSPCQDGGMAAYLFEHGNPAAQQIDFYIRSPARNEANHPNREVFDHFFAMEVTWR
jgi:hypothetical protein